jgi:hypothetical protein
MGGWGCGLIPLDNSRAAIAVVCHPTLLLDDKLERLDQIGQLLRADLEVLEKLKRLVRAGKPCGNSYIAASKDCHQGVNTQNSLDRLVARVDQLLEPQRQELSKIATEFYELQKKQRVARKKFAAGKVSKEGENFKEIDAEYDRKLKALSVEHERLSEKTRELSRFYWGMQSRRDDLDRLNAAKLDFDKAQKGDKAHAPYLKKGQEFLENSGFVARINSARKTQEDFILAMDKILDEGGKNFAAKLEGQLSRLNEAEDKIFSGVLDTLKENSKSSNTSKINILPGATRQFSEPEIRAEMDDFAAITNGKGLKNLKSIDYLDKRAYNNFGKINIGESRNRVGMKQTIFHEMGHSVEFDNPKLFAAGMDFVLSRATGKMKLLDDIVAHKGYGEEMAYPDKFFDPYVGKTYPNSTEVYSMGLQQLISPSAAKELYRKDPNHFLLTIGAITSND